MLITINKLKRVCVQPCTAAANATPLAFAAERRTTAAPAALRAVQQLIEIVCPQQTRRKLV